MSNEEKTEITRDDESINIFVRPTLQMTILKMDKIDKIESFGDYKVIVSVAISDEITCGEAYVTFITLFGGSIIIPLGHFLSTIFKSSWIRSKGELKIKDNGKKVIFGPMEVDSSAIIDNFMKEYSKDVNE